MNLCIQGGALPNVHVIPFTCTHTRVGGTCIGVSRLSFGVVRGIAEQFFWSEFVGLKLVFQPCLWMLMIVTHSRARCGGP